MWKKKNIYFLKYFSIYFVAFLRKSTHTELCRIFKRRPLVPSKMKRIQEKNRNTDEEGGEALLVPPPPDVSAAAKPPKHCLFKLKNS